MAIAPSSSSHLLSPPPFPASHAVDRPTQRHLRSLYLSLRRGQLRGSTQVALDTAKALRRVISGSRFTSMEDLSRTVRLTGAWLQDARKGEQSITNITLRTLHLLAEESGALLGQDPSEGPSRASTLPATPRDLQQTGSSTTPFFNSTPAASSPVSSAPPSVLSTPQRPSLYSRTDSNFFGHGSTFSISDLVAAGQNAGSSNINSLPGSSGLNSGVNSGATTPALGGGNRSGGFSLLGMAAASGSLMSRVNEMGEGSGDGSEKQVTFRDGLPSTQEADSDDEDDGDEGNEDDDTEEEESDETEDDSMATAGGGGAAGHRGAALSANVLKQLKQGSIGVSQELIDELETTRSNIARDARDHIHAGEVILTMGHSLTVEAFLKQASRDRSFTVIVADAGSSEAVSKYSSSLPKTLKLLSIPNSSIYTLLPRVTKVILSPHAILANGGLLAAPGATAACIAAKIQSTPVLVLAGLHKVCGDWRWVGIASSSGAGAGGGSTAGWATSTGQMSNSKGADTASLAGDHWIRCPPQTILPMGSGQARNGHLLEGVDEVLLNEWDYVEPEGVDVLITNSGEFPGSYVYRLLSENFAE